MNAPSETILWGKIVKTHGVKGEVLADIYSEDTAAYETLESVFVEIKQKQIPFFISYYKVTNQSKVILGFEDVDSTTAASALVGAALYLPIHLLDEADEGRLFLQQIEGYQVVDERLGSLGIISDYIQKSLQEILVMEYKGVAVMFPAVEPIVQSIDHRTKMVLTLLPEGLLDIYLSNSPTTQDDGWEEIEDAH